jgi:hypothetical protein
MNLTFKNNSLLARGWILACAFIFFFIFSCKKHEDFISKKGDIIEEAKQAFANASEKQSVKKSAGLDISQLERTVDWSTTFEKKYGDTSVLYSRVKFSQNIILKENNIDAASINNISWLVSSRIGEKFEFFLVMKVPQGSNNQSVLVVNNWFYDKPAFFGHVGSTQPQVSSSTRGGMTTMAISCYSFEYTICVGDGAAMSCGTRSETVCVDSGPQPIEHFDPDYGGSGSGPGGGGIGSSPGQPGPCNNASRSLIKTAQFKSMMASLQSTTGDNKEYGYTYVNGSTFQQSALVVGAANSGNIPFTLSNLVDGIAHTHYGAPDTFSIFTIGDLYLMADVYRFGKMGNTSTFTYSVTTAYGTEYSLRISDLTNFQSFVSSATSANRDYYENQYIGGIITGGGNNTLNEKGMVQLLQALNSGLTLVDKNGSDLMVDAANNVVPVQCN